MTDLATYGLRTQIDTMKSIAAAREKLVREQAEVIAKMREALAGVELFFDRPDENSLERFERVAEQFHRETGYLRPGKDCVVHDPEVRQAEWKKWVDGKLLNARAALAEGR